MSLRVARLTELTSDDLSSCRRLPLSGVFCSQFLLDVWSTEYQWEDRVLTTDTATMIGFVKKTPLGSIFYSLPFGWYGGVLGNTPAEDDVASIFDWLERKAFLQENIVQLRSSDSGDVSYPGRYNQRELLTHVLDLQVKPEFNENTRRNIRRSSDSNLKVLQCSTNGLQRFLGLLREQVSRTQERRRLPESFYSKLYLEGCKESGDVLTLGTLHDDDLCAVHIYFRNEIDYFYFDGVASKRGLELGANFLLFYDVISRGQKAGMLRLNFGATPSGDAGLKRFKSGWGARKLAYTEYSRRSLLKQGIDFVVRR